MCDPGELEGTGLNPRYKDSPSDNTPGLEC